MAKVWARIHETIERYGTAGLLSVIDSAGSVPREAGARIVLQPDGSFFGTIGGGRLEYEAIAAARAALSAGRGAAQFRDWPLGPNLGQCCGGMVRTLTETFDAGDIEAVRHFMAAEELGAFLTRSGLADDGRIIRALDLRTAGGEDMAKAVTSFDPRSFREGFGDAITPVLLFGAGHVGRAVVLSLAPLPFMVRWIDGRTDQFPQYIPQNVVAVCTEAMDRELADAPHHALVVVMTHSHPLDFNITVKALQLRKFNFVGLIGSETKRARFANWARQIGVPDSEIVNLVCPIGFAEIKGKEPAIIAAGLTAQLLVARERPFLPPAQQAIDLA